MKIRRVDRLAGSGVYYGYGGEGELWVRVVLTWRPYSEVRDWLADRVVDRLAAVWADSLVDTLGVGAAYEHVAEQQHV